MKKGWWTICIKCVIGFFNVVSLLIIFMISFLISAIITVDNLPSRPEYRQEETYSQFRRLERLVTLYRQDVESHGRQGCCRLFLTKEGKLDQTQGGAQWVAAERQSEYEKYMAEAGVIAMKPLCDGCDQILLQTPSESKNEKYYLYSDVFVDASKLSCRNYVFEKSDWKRDVGCKKLYNSPFYRVVYIGN